MLFLLGWRGRLMGLSMDMVLDGVYTYILLFARESESVGLWGLARLV